MTRKVYIGDIDGNLDACMDKIKRTSEDRLHIYVLSKQDLVEHQLTNNVQNDNLMFFVPFLNQYQGLALYVNSTFTPTMDVDVFFNYKVMNNAGSIVYFPKHDAWLFDCNDKNLKVLTPKHINDTEISKLKSELTITIVNNI